MLIQLLLVLAELEDIQQHHMTLVQVQVVQIVYLGLLPLLAVVLVEHLDNLEELQTMLVVKVVQVEAAVEEQQVDQQPVQDLEIFRQFIHHKETMVAMRLVDQILVVEAVALALWVVAQAQQHQLQQVMVELALFVHLLQVAHCTMCTLVVVVVDTQVLYREQ
jgi:hypothetical protein